MNLFVLSILYVFAFSVYFFVGTRRVIKRNKIELLDCITLMYSLVYGLIPAITYYFESKGERNLLFYDYSSRGIGYLYLIFFFSVATFFAMQLIGWGIRRTRVIDSSDIDSQIVYQVDLLKCGVIALIIGFVCLYLWTRAYGSLQNFIINAPRIRSGAGTIYNQFAFMKQFVKILLIALYAFVSALLRDSPKGLKRIGYWVLILVSGFGAYLYLLASDSRSSIVFSGVAVVLISVVHKDGKISRRLVRIGIILGVILVMAMLGETFADYIRYGVWIGSSEDWIHRFINEFSYIVSSQGRSISCWMEQGIKYKAFDDWLNAGTSWIPERFLPFSLPATVWTYNTQLINSGLKYGTVPADPMATGIYKFGLCGAIIQPVFLSFIVAKFDNMLDKMRNRGDYDVYFGALAVTFIQCFRAYQMSSFMEMIFPIFLFFLIEKSANTVRRKHFKLVVNDKWRQLKKE